LVGVLLDTHALFWLVSGEDDLTDEALIAIGESQEQGTLFVSPISAWELAVATQKSRVADRPHLGDDPPGRWFQQAVSLVGATIVPIRQRVSCEAADVAVVTGHRDPGDCFLMATARLRRLTLVTRDERIRHIAATDPAYLTTLAC
jgi:PIN domain nuclease of toxin-antitoxin system